MNRVFQLAIKHFQKNLLIFNNFFLIQPLIKMIFINHAVNTFYKEKHILKNMHVHFNGQKMHVSETCHACAMRVFCVCVCVCKCAQSKC